jgi:hypothetical protein
VIAGLGYTIKEGKRTATKLGIFYEGLNMGVYNGYYVTRYSYLIGNVSGLTSPQLIYIPTAEELTAMPFSSEESRAAFEEFISNNRYLSKHRGEYSKRNGGKAPWLNRINLKVAQDFILDVAGKPTTLQVGVDVLNVANLLNSNWGLTKQVSSENILEISKAGSEGVYTFTAPTVKNYRNTFNTWQLLLSARLFF